MALSSTKSEYKFQIEATNKAMWIQNLFKELGFVKKAPLLFYITTKEQLRSKITLCVIPKKILWHVFKLCEKYGRKSKN
jgi:hypothetical protein